MSEHRLHVLAHTHWDREWYLPFQQFRFKLVGLLDDLLPRLDSDEGLAHFQLDGQVAVIDDYLEIRPQHRETLQRLVTSGRLAIGPWYVLPDEFLVSGETHIRNLQRGIKRAQDFGGAMQVGYLPDMFGHIAQLPQILSLFNMEHALVWRGVPSTMTDSSFMWESPDGTAVRAEYLPGGYFNGADTPNSAPELLDRINNFLAFNGSFVSQDVLWMAGMDHEVPADHLESVIQELNALDSNPSVSATVTSLSEYLAVVSEHEDQSRLQRLHGELRSSARSNILMGVLSNRVDVKILAARAERLLERQAEPLHALWGDNKMALDTLLDVAWTQLIVNSAHDSICACSHDDVVTAVNNRYLEAIHIGNSVVDSALDTAAHQFSEPGVYVINPTARTRDTGALVNTTVNSLDDLPADSYQIVATSPQVERLYTAPTTNAAMLFARESMEVHPEAGHMIVTPDPEADDVLFVRMYEDERAVHGDATVDAPALNPLEAMSAIGQWCTSNPSGSVATWLHRKKASYDVVVYTSPVPGYGWSKLDPVATNNPVVTTDRSIGNGLVEVVVADDGTYAVNGNSGFGRLVDQGDAGDSYNWSPPDHDIVVDSPTSSRVSVVEHGPLRGQLRIESTYDLPIGLLGSELEGFTRNNTTQPVVITTTLTVRASDAAVVVETTLDHRIQDHRLRVELPLPHRTDRSLAECAYGVVERSLTAESGPNEWGIPTFPSRRFVHAGGLTVTHEGLCEYELLGDGQADRLAVTLVRATGWISRGPMTSRPMPAGPPVALPNAQLPGVLTLKYAFRVDAASSWQPDDGYAFADATWNPPYVVHSNGEGTLPVSGSRIDVTGAEVTALYRNDAGELTLRAHEANGESATLQVHQNNQACSGTIMNLLGESLGEFMGSYQLRPHEIVTVRLQ